MITLKLYPSEFRELMGYLWIHTEGQQYLPLGLQQVGKLILINYRERWTRVRLQNWKNRQADKAFALRLTVVVALALYQDMQGVRLTSHQQLLLTKLDQAIINYQPPGKDDFSLLH